jgi:hypothetical protein
MNKITQLVFVLNQLFCQFLIKSYIYTKQVINLSL